MDERGTAGSEVILALVCALTLLVSTAARWPYFVYVLLRVLICACSIYLAVQRYQERETLQALSFAAIVLLFNPVLPIRMARSDWRLLDLIVTVFFIGWAVYWIVRDSEVKRGS